MKTYRPTTLDTLLHICADEQDAVLLAGGTDVMVDVNHDRLRPEVVVDVSRVKDLRGWRGQDGHLWIGAGTTFASIEHELAVQAPALAMAARTVGSPQIRHRATLGGNIGTASPAGDALPVLVATRATVELASVRGVRGVPARNYFLGPHRTVRAPDECVLAVLMPAASGSAQQFCKIGVRNAMVIAIASFALHLDAERGTVGTGMGSVGPVPLAAPEAEDWLQERLFGGSGPPRRVDADAVRHFGALVADAAAPIDDLRGTAAYRRHVLQVMARRALSWALGELEVAACG